MFNVNKEITKNVIYSYTKNILYWLCSCEKDNILSINEIRSLINESISFTITEITKLIKNDDYQGLVNQQAILIIIMGSLNAIDNGVEQLKQYLTFDDITTMQTVNKAINDADILINNSYKIIGLNKYNNNLYLQNIGTSKFIKCYGIINYKNDVIYNKFLLNSTEIIDKKDINVTDIYLDKMICINNLEKNNSKLYSIHNIGEIDIFDNNKFYDNTAIIDLPKEWINVEKFNSNHETYLVTNSYSLNEIKKRFDNPLILNTFGIDILPDIIFADIIIINEFMYTEKEISERLYNRNNVTELKRNVIKV